MQSIGPYLVGVAFWIFVGACCVAAIVTDYKRRRGNIELLRTAIDKGHQLDPTLIEKLTSSERSEERLDPLHLKLGGIITIAAGVGIGLLALFMVGVVPIAFYPIFGVGLLAVCIGIGLIVGSKVLAGAREREQPRNPLP